MSAQDRFEAGLVEFDAGLARMDALLVEMQTLTAEHNRLIEAYRTALVAAENRAFSGMLEAGWADLARPQNPTAEPSKD